MDAVLRAHQEVSDKRPIYVFELPEDFQKLNDQYVKKSVGFVKLKMREELRCLDQAGGSSAKAAYYMVMAALVEVDGRPVQKQDAEDETIVNNVDPSIRSLMVDGYADISGTDKEATKVFLKSRTVKIG